MRKIFIVTLGLVSLGVSTELALARQASCTQATIKCWNVAGSSQDASAYCDSRYRQCLQDGSWGIAGPGTYARNFKGNTPAPSKTSASVAAPARASTGATSAAIPRAAIVRDHRGDTPRIPIAGNAPPAAAPKDPVSTPTNMTGNTPIVRDHRKR